MSATEFEKGIRHSFTVGNLSIEDVAQINYERRSKGRPVVSLKGCRTPSAATVALARSRRSKAAAAAKAYRSTWGAAEARAWANSHRQTRGASSQLVTRAMSAIATADAAMARCR